MSIYLTSDIHGCYEELRLLLDKSSFNPKKDYLWIAGDLVSRGPNSLQVLEYLYSLKHRVKIVLGNHDLNLISVYAGIKKNKKSNFFDKLLSSSSIDKLIKWLRCQKILKIDQHRKIIMSHAGISPQWNISIAKKYALKIQQHLSNINYDVFLESMYNNQINFWDFNLNQLDLLRYSINSFTRMRYCYPDGKLNMFFKKSPKLAPFPLQPWFLIQHNIPIGYSVFFGHWSSLKNTYVPKPFYSLDSGCCWKGELTMFRWEDKKVFSQPYLLK